MRNVRSVIVYSTITAMLSFQAVTGAGHHGHVTQVLAAAIEDSVPSAEPITAGVKDGLFAQASNVSATAGVAGVLPPTTTALLHNGSTILISVNSMKNLLE